MNSIKTNGLGRLFKQLKTAWSSPAVPARSCSLATCTPKNRNDARKYFMSLKYCWIPAHSGAKAADVADARVCWLAKKKNGNFLECH